MSRLFYPKLALTNIKKNAQVYLPYLLTGIGTVAMFYIMCMIATNEGIKKMPGASSLTSILGFGSVVIGVFSTIFLFYTNSFLIKRRKKELGLYNILGMGKRHIARILFFETLLVCICAITLGLAFGIMLSRLIFLLLFKILTFTVPIGFIISAFSLKISVLLFGAIYFATLLSNLIQIRLSKPIELLKGGNIGEREPKTKWLLAVIGLVTLSAGYIIALATKSPLKAIACFFFAVLLVIVGTYCLFTAGSIALLKLLRKNKGYYYKTKHFITVSGMIYRMKQNAAGLASICILSTMVLVTVSTTVSLYIGTDNQLSNRYPTDIAITANVSDNQQSADILQTIKSTAASQNRTISNLTDYHSLSFTVIKKGDAFTAGQTNLIYNSDVTYLSFFTAGEYAKLSGKQVSLSPNEVLIYSHNDQTMDSFTLFGRRFRAVRYLSQFPIGGGYTDALIDSYYVVVKDGETLDEIYNAQSQAYGGDASRIKYDVSFNINGDKKQKIACFSAIAGAVKQLVAKTQADVNDSVYAECRQSAENGFYATYGGFLFIGIFLGLLFLMATVLIIYYKQISEGYNDKERFEIMQKVGMSQDEIKSSIRAQIVMVFFLPLAAAVLHIAAAFRMITKLLSLFNLTNIPLFITCTAFSIIVFGIIYCIVYALTAKAYYKIIS